MFTYLRIVLGKGVLKSDPKHQTWVSIKVLVFCQGGKTGITAPPTKASLRIMTVGSMSRVCVHSAPLVINLDGAQTDKQTFSFHL